MQEIFLLIHLLFTGLECVSLLVGEYGAALFLRAATSTGVLYCSWQRKKISSLNGGNNDIDRQRQYYTQLVYLFVAIDIMAYPLTVLALLLLPFKHSSGWLYLWIFLFWLTVWLRLYIEKISNHVELWKLHDHVETEKSRESV